MKKRVWTTCYLAGLFLLIAGAGRVDAQSIGFVGTNPNSTDYSPTGLNIGTAGFWFAQFNATSPITGALVDDNDVNQFPAWVLPEFNKADPDYSFALGADAFSEGGDTTWNFLKLPNAVTGLSGSVVDPNSVNNSSNTITKLLLGPGTPAEFLMHVVVDNTNGEHDPRGRLRARGERVGVFDISGPNNPTVAANFNGVADVYTFRYTGFAPGDIIKLQLNSGVAGEAAGFAGLMFDVTIPEPSSIVSLAIGSVVLAGMRRRRAARS